MKNLFKDNRYINTVRKQKMDQVVKLNQVDLKTLVNTNSPNTSLNFRSKIVDELNHNFTEDEKKWFIANLYVYLHYHPTNDFPIDLENIYKLIGFTSKKNAKRTLINNFTENEDYKITVLPKEHGQFTSEKAAAPYGEAGFSGVNLGGAGLNKEVIMLNVDTFKNMCMITKTEKSKEIRAYYVKLEKIFNKLTSDEITEHKRKLKESEEKILLLEHENKEKEELLMKQIEECENKDLRLLEQEKNAYVKKEKTYFDLFPLNTQCVYFGSIGNRSKTNEKLIKFGITNDLKRRVSEHKRIFIDFKLEHVYRVSNNIHIENEIKKYQDTRRANMLKNESKRKKNNRLRSIFMEEDSKNYTELLALDDETYTLEYFHNMILGIIEEFEYNVVNHQNLHEKYAELTAQNKVMEYEIIELKKLNEKLRQEIENYKPTMGAIDKEIKTKTEKFSAYIHQGVHLYIFKCDNNQGDNEFKFKFGIARLCEFEHRDKLLKITEGCSDGSMKYSVIIHHPFFEKFAHFLIKKTCLTLKDNIYDGSYSDLKGILDTVVTLEKMVYGNDIYTLCNLLNNTTTIVSGGSNTTESIPTAFGPGQARNSSNNDNTESDAEVPKARKARRPVDIIDPKTRAVVQTCKTIVEAARYVGTSDTAIGIALRNRTLCKGFLFSYAGISLEDSGTEQPVIKINCSSGEKKRFPNMAAAARDIGITYVALRQRILTKLHTDGFHWIFERPSESSGTLH